MSYVIRIKTSYAVIDANSTSKGSFIAQRRVTLSTSSTPKNVPLFSFFFWARSREGFFESMTIMNLQFIPIFGKERRPIEAFGNGRRFVERGLRLLIGHFQEEEKRELLDVITVRETVITKNIAVVPEFRDELLGIAHDFLFFRWMTGNAFNSLTAFSKSASTG